MSETDCGYSDSKIKDRIVPQCDREEKAMARQWNVESQDVLFFFLKQNAAPVRCYYWFEIKQNKTQTQHVCISSCAALHIQAKL